MTDDYDWIQTPDKAALRRLIEKIVLSNDMTRFTPRMLFVEVATLIDRPVEDVTNNRELKAMIKDLAKQIVSDWVNAKSQTHSNSLGYSTMLNYYFARQQKRILPPRRFQVSWLKQGKERGRRKM